VGLGVGVAVSYGLENVFERFDLRPQPINATLDPLPPESSRRQ
jgi:hypothetical protein